LVFWRIAVFKKLLLTGAALALFATPGFAADLPMQAPVYVPPPVYNWTGFYIGGHVGGGWGDSSSIELAPGSASFPIGTVFNRTHTSGPLAGVQGGFNWQIGGFVLGVEGEFTAMGLSGTETTISAVNGFDSIVAARTESLEAVTGRIGYAVNNWLIFAKGGGAWTSGSSNGQDFLANGTFFETTSTRFNRNGWIAGGGFEWGFAPAWSAKFEYNHVDLGSTIITVVPSRGTNTFINSSYTIDLVKAGVNYHFNWGGPVVANY
jgi:outer membrane immunogenic protein